MIRKAKMYYHIDHLLCLIFKTQIFKPFSNIKSNMESVKVQVIEQIIYLKVDNSLKTVITM